MKIKKHIASIIILVTLIITSIGTYLCYPFINQATQKSSFESRDISDYMSSYLIEYSYASDFLLKESQDPSASIYDYYQSSQDEINADYYYDFQSAVEDKVNELHQKEDIFFHITDHQSQKQFSNTNDPISQISQNKDLQDKYQWYMQIEFDNKGVPKVTHTNDEHINIYSLESLFSYSTTFYDDYSQEDITIRYQPLQNITITLAVSDQLHMTSQIGSYLMNISRSQLYLYSLPYIFTAIVVCCIVTLCIPMKYLEQSRFLSFMMRIKFAFLALIWGTLAIMMYAGTAIMIAGTIQDQFQYIYQQFAIEAIGPYLTPAINIAYYFIFYLLFIILAYFVKYLFHKGLKKYFWENTCLGWLITHGYQIMNKVIDFDLNDPLNKTVLKIVLFNLLIIAGCSIFFVFGIFFAVFYSIIIFILIRKKFQDIQNDYHTLLKATQQLSNGHFDVQINQDIGIFNPLKDEFVHIKDGFEKAVKEEVKSQRMKTELISNVSHDLKTPIALIQTYAQSIKDDVYPYGDKDSSIDIILENADRLEHKVKSFLYLNRLDYLQGEDNEIGSFAIQDLIEKIVLQMDFMKPDLHLETELEDVQFDGDEEHWRVAIENIIENASRYAKSVIKITLKEDYLEIYNDGENIDEATLPYLFDPYVKGVKGQFGLGLSIVSKIASMFQYSVTAKNHDVGVSFIFQKKK